MIASAEMSLPTAVLSVLAASKRSLMVCVEIVGELPRRVKQQRQTNANSVISGLVPPQAASANCPSFTCTNRLSSSYTFHSSTILPFFQW